MFIILRRPGRHIIIIFNLDNKIRSALYRYYDRILLVYLNHCNWFVIIAAWNIFYQTAVRPRRDSTEKRLSWPDVTQESEKKRLQNSTKGVSDICTRCRAFNTYIILWFVITQIVFFCFVKCTHRRNNLNCTPIWIWRLKKITHTNIRWINYKDVWWRFNSDQGFYLMQAAELISALNSLIV